MNSWCFDRFQELGLRGIFFLLHGRITSFAVSISGQSMPMLWMRGGCQLSHLFMEIQIVLKGVWDLRDELLVYSYLCVPCECIWKCECVKAHQLPTLLKLSGYWRYLNISKKCCI